MSVVWIGAAVLVVVVAAATALTAFRDAAPDAARGLASSPAVSAASSSAAAACRFWVAPEPVGDDDAPGTRRRPWATLDHAVQAVPDKGCTVLFAPGVYRGQSNPKRRFDNETTFMSMTPYRAVLEHDGTVLDIDGGRNITIAGFELRHPGPETPSSDFVAIVDRRDETWSERIVFRDNIFHDSYGDDLLKIHNGVRDATVDGNVFYNAGGDEQAIDVNSVSDVDIHDNIFFSDYEGSGRAGDKKPKHFIVVKDSGVADDGLEGTRDVVMTRNVFLNWEGGAEQFVKMGNDGRPYFEAQDVLVENNLLIGNSAVPADAAFGVRGARDVVFNNNTIVGDLPGASFAYRIHLKGDNPRNDDIRFTNNVWSDPTGTMGADEGGDDPQFADGDTDEVIDLVNDTNLYWNGGGPVPDGGFGDPLEIDPGAVDADPLLPSDQDDIVLPRWEGERFASGATSIREEFVRLVRTYGTPSENSPAVDAADPRTAATVDILGRKRSRPDLGAVEVAAEDGS